MSKNVLHERQSNLYSKHELSILGSARTILTKKFLLVVEWASSSCEGCSIFNKSKKKRYHIYKLVVKLYIWRIK